MRILATFFRNSRIKFHLNHQSCFYISSKVDFIEDIEKQIQNNQVWWKENVSIKSDFSQTVHDFLAFSPRELTEYSLNSILPKDKQLAAYCFKIAADKGDGNAAYNLSKLFEQGNRDKDKEKIPIGEERKSVIKEIRSQQRENSRRKRGLENIKRKGHPIGEDSDYVALPEDANLGSSKQDEISLKWLETAVLLDNIDAYVKLGNYLLRKKDKVGKEDCDRALSLYKKAATAAITTRSNATSSTSSSSLITSSSDVNISPINVDAMYNLGIIYYEGVGNSEIDSLVVDPQHGFQWIQKAASHGDASAMYFLGYAYHQGDELANIEKDVKQSVAYLNRAADLGHPSAMYYLATLYLDDNNSTATSTTTNSTSESETIPEEIVNNERSTTCCIKPDKDKSLKYLNASAEAGYAEAWYCKGTLSYEDLDFESALSHFKKAGELGSVEGWLNTGALLYNGSPDDGLSIPIDLERSFQAYEQAVELGSVDGMRNLASMYAKGEGTPKSMDTAKYLLQFAKSVEKAQ